MPPKVSVITVVRNNRAGLEKTLANLTAMDYPALELVVIDGNSTDGTQDVIEKYSARIAYSVSEPDEGLYDAMNKGLLAATGDYVWFVNSGDTVFAPDTLSKILGKTDNTTEGLSDIYYGEAVITDSAGNVLGLRKKLLPKQLTFKSLQKGMVVCHQSFIVRRDIAPLYDLEYRYVSDIDWVIRCLQRASKVENVHMALSRFETGGISTRHRRKGLRERWKIMRKYYGWRKTFLAHVGFVFDALRPGYRAVTGENEYPV